TTRENAAKMFSRARDFARAARMMVSCRNWKAAAGYFEQAGDFASAAKSYQSAGETAKAAAAFDRGGQVDLAMRLYESCGARDAMADCLVRHGRALEGADLYRALGNVRGEVEALRQINPDDPSKPTAALRLAVIYETFNRLPEATQLLVETLRVSPLARNDAALVQQLAVLFEKQGQTEQAQKARAHLASLSAPAPILESIPVVAADDYPPRTEYEALKAIPIFAELALEDMKDLYRIGEQKRFAEGEVLVEADVEAPGLTVLAEGAADVLAGDRKLNTLKPGDYLGEISLIQGGRTSARVVARSPIRALTISRERFEHYLYAHEAAATRIWKLFAVNLAERVRALSSRK
ncbi:MAG: cyclic nucleotide-binding domain-containing protein, partial [Deltaproteobacteria bacterium]|nr:cyclic nucleotide-binding domain-containing protein [Deltaproteobacteria bacterium]